MRKQKIKIQKNNSKLNKLFQLFADYKIYPKSCYKENTAVRIFQRMFPNNYFSKDLEKLIRIQNYEPEKRGADLPWWGEKYFKDDKGYRVFIVFQDSLVTDAGSIVFGSQLFSVINTDDKENYIKFEKSLSKTSNSFFHSWNTVKKLFTQWKLNFNFLYITDASKVYKKNSWEDKDFDKVKSLELLEKEIELCDPDLIILLGRDPISLLNKEIANKYSETIMNERVIKIKKKDCIIAPFPTGSGRAQKDFKIKIKKVESMLNKIINK